MSNKTKFRYERKYLLDRDAAFLLKQRISYVLHPDASTPDGQYTVSSLYFDDIYSTSFYQKMNGVLSRDKYRIRFYNGNMDRIRLECKHKHGEMVCKETATLSFEEYQMMNRGEYVFMRNQQPDSVFEKFYISHVLKHMSPVIMVDYNRQAYMHHAGNVRITFDSNILASIPVVNHSYTVLSDENIVMEVKYDRFIPSFVSGLLTGVPFTQLAISKYAMSKLAIQGMHINNRYEISK